MTSQHLSAYQKMEVTKATHDPNQLILMLYDGALKFIKAAALAIEQRDVEKRGIYIGKTLDIVAKEYVVGRLVSPYKRHRAGVARIPHETKHREKRRYPDTTCNHEQVIGRHATQNVRKTPVRPVHSGRITGAHPADFRREVAAFLHRERQSILPCGR